LHRGLCLLKYGQFQFLRARFEEWPFDNDRNDQHEKEEDDDPVSDADLEHRPEGKSFQPSNEEVSKQHMEGAGEEKSRTGIGKEEARKG